MPTASSTHAGARAPSHIQELYERDAELDELTGVLQSPASGVGRLGVILGHAGIGKSALVEAAIEAAQTEELCCYRAHGCESEREFPFALVLRLFEPHVRLASTSERRELFAGPAELARPLFEGRDERGSIAGERERLPSLLHGLYCLTVNLSQHSPLLLALDDLHLSDESSLRYLLYAAARLEQLPVAIVVAARPRENSTTEPLLNELSDAPRACVVQPAPLSRRAIKALVEEQLPFAVEEQFTEACARVTRGNPFLLRELLTGLLAAGMGTEEATPERVLGVVPETVAKRIVVGLGRLPRKAAALAGAIAVLGDEVPLRWAAALAGLAWNEALDAADMLAAADILDPPGFGLVCLTFVHPIVRAAVYGDQSPGNRARSHTQAVQLLLKHDVGPERVALHLLRSPPAMEPRAIELLREAAREAVERGAPDSAVSFLRRALEEPLEAEIAGHVTLELAGAELAAGELDDAERHAEDARRLLYEPGRRAEAKRILELAALGTRRRSETERGLDWLTPGETRVANLAAQGLTNRQIAQTLFVTVKAVEWHLHHVYQKLDIRSRKELPEALADDKER